MSSVEKADMTEEQVRAEESAQGADVYVHKSHSARASVSVVSKVMQYLSVNWKDLSQIMHWKMISNRKNRKRQTDIK